MVFNLGNDKLFMSQIKNSYITEKKKTHDNWIAGEISQSALDKTDHSHQNLF